MQMSVVSNKRKWNDGRHSIWLLRYFVSGMSILKYVYDIIDLRTLCLYSYLYRGLVIKFSDVRRKVLDGCGYKFLLMLSCHLLFTCICLLIADCLFPCFNIFTGIGSFYNIQINERVNHLIGRNLRLPWTQTTPWK